MSLEVQPFGCVIGAFVPSFVQFELSFAPLDQPFHLLGELCLLVRMYASGKLCQRDARLRQDMAVVVGHAIVLDVVLHHIEVAHVQSFVHHVVQFGRLAGGALHVSFGQTDEQIDEDYQYQRA